MRRFLIFWSVVACGFATSISAAPPSPAQAGTSVANRSNKRIPESPFRCDRLFIHDGQTLPCDSHLYRDGERLRSIMADTPSAIELLDRYQRNRARVTFAAYTGTAGLAILATNGLIADAFSYRGTPSDQDRRRKNMANAVRWTGIGITATSVVYGLLALKANENNLTNAVIRYNEDHPGKPIELLFQHDF